MKVKYIYFVQHVYNICCEFGRVRGLFKKFCHALNITLLAMPIHIWFILIYLGRYHEQKSSLIHHEIFSLKAAELSTLIHVEGTDKFNFHSHFRNNKRIRQCFL